MDWNSMSEQSRIEYAGFLYFNRVYEEDWELYECDCLRKLDEDRCEADQVDQVDQVVMEEF